ncbi:MAG TPA: efflux RND transporter periplasmic adaptor subunit [Ignavibacteria bacterium]|nr:efflux RND transporter periplasmic adaptor subunit [Ignavibacteria bacterium]
MKSKLVILITALILSAGFYSCSKGDSEEKQQTEEKKLPLVKVKTVETSVFSDNFKVIGTIKPFAEAKVSSEEGGLLVTLNKDKGSYVGRGEIIARIKKDVEYATYEQMEAQVNLAKMNYEKQKLLWEENATTELQYLTAEWQYKSAERQLEVMKMHLKTGYIRSPISGVVSEKFMNKGEMTSPGSPILHIIDISTVKISAGVPEMYLPKIKKGQNVNVTIDVLPGVDFEGKVNYIAPALSGTSRTVEIEIILRNKDRVLKPGMSANIQISEYSDNSAVVIEQDLIIDYGNEQFVFILEGDTAKKRVIKVDGSEGNKVRITSGLNPGDKLIYDGFQSLKEGEKVQVVQ